MEAPGPAGEGPTQAVSPCPWGKALPGSWGRQSARPLPPHPQLPRRLLSLREPLSPCLLGVPRRKPLRFSSVSSGPGTTGTPAGGSHSPLPSALALHSDPGVPGTPLGRALRATSAGHTAPPGTLRDAVSCPVLQQHVTDGMHEATSKWRRRDTDLATDLLPHTVQARAC